MNILAIETSCDETAASVVQDGTKILSSVVASSSKMHEKYGGIVPEVAAREQLRCIIPVIREALEPLETFHATRANEAKRQTVLGEVIKRHIDAIAVTIGPGLVGSLLVGVETAKTIAFVTGKPIIPVNHVLAHMYANFVQSCQPSAVSRQPKNTKLQAESRELIAFPAISLVVSGGHTELYLMKSFKDLTWLGGTLDDAAGECFDKTARLLGFGHGGGVAIEREAQKFSIQHSAFSIKLPRPMMDESFNFSFSGLKTAVMREWKKSEEHSEKLVNAFAHEIQESITDVLVEKTLRAAKQYGVKSILLSGGVAANLRLREKLKEAISYQLSAISFFTPSVELCTDNAAYIASYAYFRGAPTDWHKITATPDLSVEDI